MTDNKKSYISIYLCGGLGNQLFMIANVYGIGLNYGYTPVIKHIYHSNSVFNKRRPFYHNTIFKKVNILEENEYNKIKFIKINEKNNRYVHKKNNNYLLFGYYQYDRHFIKYRENILDLFRVDDIYINKINKIYEDIKGEYKTTVSIHVRRGDYIKLKHYYNILTMEYYNNAVELFNEHVLFIVFSDDIEWCKTNMKYKNIYYCEYTEDVGLTHEETDLILMSMCDHNIIANSSFSWWGAWLNTNKNKKVVSPKRWYVNPEKNFNNRYIYCKDWIVI